MLNRVVLKGNMGRIPEVKKTHDGREYAQFFLATNAYWKDDNGKWRQQTDWHRITVFTEATVKWAKEKLKQGDTLYIEGKLTYHNWKDRFGQHRSTPHVIISGHECHIEYLHSKRSEIEKDSSPSLSEEAIASHEPQDLSIPFLEMAEDYRGSGDEPNAPQQELPRCMG